MRRQVHAFVVTAAEVFTFHGPVVEFSYCPDSSEPHAGWPSQWAFDPKDPAASDPQADLDRLEDLARLPFADGTLRTILSIDALEHVFEPRQAVDEMIRTLAPGGLLLIASTIGPSEPHAMDRYWQPTPAAMARLLGKLDTTLVGWQGPAQSPHTVFGLGFKGPTPERFLVNVNRFLERFHARNAAAARGRGWWARPWRRLASVWRRALGLRGARLGHVRWLITPFAKPRGVQPVQACDDDQVQFVVHAPVNPGFEPRLLAGGLGEGATGGRLDLRQ